MVASAIFCRVSQLHQMWFFRTLRAMSPIVQNFFVGDWLLKRVRKSQSATIAQFSTQSVEEPQNVCKNNLSPYLPIS